jgi:hypothetical protein
MKYERLPLEVSNNLSCARDCFVRCNHSSLRGTAETIRKQDIHSGLLHCVRNDGRRQFASSVWNSSLRGVAEAIREQGIHSGLLHCVRNDGQRQFASTVWNSSLRGAQRQSNPEISGLLRFARNDEQQWIASLYDDALRSAKAGAFAGLKARLQPCIPYPGFASVDACFYCGEGSSLRRARAIVLPSALADG